MLFVYELYEYLEDANAFFAENAGLNNTFAEKVSHKILGENYEEINQAFIINGNPINQRLIDAPEKREAFNNKHKFQCNIICGDIVGMHLVQSASYDEEGNLIKRALRDIYTKEISEILVSGDEAYKLAKDFFKILPF